MVKGRPQSSSCISKRTPGLQPWTGHLALGSCKNKSALLRTVSELASKKWKRTPKVWDPQGGYMNWQSPWEGDEDPLLFPHLNHQQQISMGNEDALQRQAKAVQLPQEKHVTNFLTQSHSWIQIWPCTNHPSFRHMRWLILPDSLKSQVDETESNVRTDAELHGEAGIQSHLAVRKQQHFKPWVWLWWLLTAKNDASISWATKASGCFLK